MRRNVRKVDRVCEGASGWMEKPRRRKQPASPRPLCVIYPGATIKKYSRYLNTVQLDLLKDFSNCWCFRELTFCTVGWESVQHPLRLSVCRCIFAFCWHLLGSCRKTVISPGNTRAEFLSSGRHYLSLSECLGFQSQVQETMRSSEGGIRDTCQV